MKIISIKFARQLKEKGFPQREALHVWVSYFDKDYLWYNDEEEGIDYKWIKRNANSFCDAPTAEEILDLLPDINFHGNNYFLQIGHGIDNIWQLDYRDENDGQYAAWVGDNLADLAAGAWLDLKENNLLEAK